jgi:hypothetical protein
MTPLWCRQPTGACGAHRQSDGAMGRSQVVRQRILIPPFPGSNPGAPASQCGLFWPFPCFRKTTRDFRLLVGASVSATEKLRSPDVNRQVCASSLQSRIFHIQNSLAETWFGRAETGSTFLLFGTKQTSALNDITSPFGPKADVRLLRASQLGEASRARMSSCRRPLVARISTL